MVISSINYRVENTAKDHQRIQQICILLSASVPNPVCELDYINDFLFLISVVLSAQTTDVRVNQVMLTLSRYARSPQELSALELHKIEEIIKSLGFFRTKARNIKMLSQKLLDNFNGKVPSNRKDLESLAGVGRKTASVVLNEIFNMPEIAVDTHVIRTSRRLRLVSTTSYGNSEKTENDLHKNIPQEFKKNISNLLVLHGRYICRAKMPKCDQCVLNKLCDSTDKQHYNLKNSSK